MANCKTENDEADDEAVSGSDAVVVVGMSPIRLVGTTEGDGATEEVVVVVVFVIVEACATAAAAAAAVGVVLTLALRRP